MAAKSAGMVVVEVMLPFSVADYPVKPGARLLGSQSGQGWVLTFNGSRFAVPEGTVGEVGSDEVKEAAERRSAREEEYQSAAPG